MKNNYISRHLATSKLFFTCILCLLLAGISTTANAKNITVTGSTGADGGYDYLNEAFVKINTSAQTNNNIEIKISGDVFCNSDVNSGATLNAGTWTTLKIYPTATATVTAVENLSNNNAVINLNGADNVTIDGRLNQTGATALTLKALGSNSVNVIKFSNSAIFNTVKFCTLRGKSNENNCGLISFSTSSNISGNSFNTIDNCNITSISDSERSVYGIYSAGTSGFENSNNTIINNKFYNFGNANRISSAIYIKEFSNAFNINGNHFFQPVTAPSSSYAMSYIYLNTGDGYTISNNYMGGTATYCGGTAPTLTFTQSGTVNFCPIYMNVGTFFPSTIQNNTIQNLNVSCADPAFSSIYVAAGAVNIIGNTIGSSTTAQSININATDQNKAKTTYVIKIDGINNIYIKNNIIGGIYTSATPNGKPHSLYAIYKGARAGNLTVTGNTIGSESVPNSMYASNASNSIVSVNNAATTDNTSTIQQLVGIYTAGTDINLINENTIANLTNANTYNNSGDNKNNLAIYTTGGSNTIKDNTIYNISTPMYFVGGIYQASATANSAQIISNNTIYNLSNTNQSAVVDNTAITVASSAAIPCTISTNYIYGTTVASSDKASTLDGIDLLSGTNNCYNNIVNIGDGVSQATRLYGIYDSGVTGCINNIYHNTVYIGGSTTLAINRTSAFFRNSNVGTANVRNNIFGNSRSGGTGGKHYAAYINTDKARLTIDFNDYFVDGTNSAFGYINGTTLTNTTTNKINTAANLGAGSKVDQPPFIKVPTTSPTDFRLTTQMQGADLLAIVPTDFEGITRTVPTMGAWEKGFVTLAPTKEFTYIVGKGPSAEQQFIIDASGLTTDMTITPPTNFEISPVSGGVFTLSPITIKRNNDGTINSTIYIRLKAGLAVGSYGPDPIALSSQGTTTQNVLCKGFVIPAVVAVGGGSYCTGEDIVLTSTTTGTADNYFWTGPNSFYATGSAATIPHTLTAANTGTYTVTANYLMGPEIIKNGGFESGNNGEFTSDYTFKAPTSGGLTTWYRSCYTIISNPTTLYDVHNSSGQWGYTNTLSHSGNKQMVINAQDGVAWKQQVTIEPFTNYQLSFWVLTPTDLVDPAKIYINGLGISPIFNAPSKTDKGNWRQFIYNLPVSDITSVQLELTNIGGAEFALDDISLRKVYTSSSSVDASVIVGNQAPNVAITATPGTTVDEGTSITFTATPYNGGINPTYQWNLGTTAIPGATGATYTYVPTNGDEISCTMTSKSNCKTTDIVTSTKLTITFTVNKQRNFWKGSYDTDWGNKKNWTATKVPEDGEAVVFSKGGTYGDAQRDLLLDKDREIGSFTNNVSSLKLIIPVATRLIVNGTIDTNSDPSRILVKAYPDGTQQNGSLIFKNATDVYGSVEMYSKAKMTNSTDPNDIFIWQYFGIPVQTIKPSPTLDGAYVRKSIESGTDNDTDDNDHYLWKEMGNNDDLTAFDGYEICQPSPAMYTFSGKLVNWDKLSGKLPYTTTPPARFPGQHLFANPYTAAIDIRELVFGPDMEASVFLYHTGSYKNWVATGGESSPGEAAGQYITIPQYRAGESGIPTEVPSMSSMLIKNGVKASTDNTYLNIIYKKVVKKNETVQRVKNIDGVTNTDVISTKIDLTGQHYSDRMWIFTDPACTRNYDNGWDGRKMLGSSLAPQIYAMEPDGDYQVNSVSDMNNTDLAFQPGDEVEYTMKFTHENIQRQYAGVYLVDLIENKTIDVTENGSTYKFATALSDVPTKRFKILTRYYEKNAPDAASQLKIFSAKSYVFIQNPGTFNGDCTLYNISGQAVRKLSFGPGSITTVSNLGQGAYVISATTNGEKVSKRVIVQ